VNPPIRIPGEHGRDRAVLIGIAAEVMRDRTRGKHVAAMFVDSAFGAPIVERLHTLGYDNVHEINFGPASRGWLLIFALGYGYNWACGLLSTAMRIPSAMSGCSA
jgi:hypothetical protein